MNEKRKDGWTALMLATLTGHTSTVRILLTGGADVTAKGKDDGWTALSLAAGKGYSEIIQLLKKAGAKK